MSHAAPPGEGKSVRFARNVGFNVLGQVGIAAAGFLLIPYLVHHMGVETYGLYILMYTVAGYLGLLSFGAGSATIKYVAEFIADRNATGLADVLRYSKAIHAGGAAAGAVVAFIGARVLAERLFHVPPPLVETAVFVLRCAAAAAVFAATTLYAQSVVVGFQRFDLYNLIAFSQSALMPAGAALVLAAGFGLKGTAIWYAAFSAALCGSVLALAGRLLSRTRGFPAGPGLDARTFGGYGVSLWLGALAWIVTFQFDKVYLARGVSLTGLTLYSVPSGLLQRLQTLPGTVFAVLVPMISELRGPEAHESLRRIYLKSVRFLLWVMMPAYVLLFALMPQFLSLWLGGDFGGASVWPARLLVISQFFFVLNFIPNAVAAGRDRPIYVSIVAWAQALISVVAWKLLVPRYQLIGVAAGSLLAQALPAMFYLEHMHRRVLKIGWRLYLDEGLRAPLTGSAILLAVVFPLHAGATSWIKLFALGGCGAAAYYASAWFLLAHDDRLIVRKLLRR